jgi:hypothetical protein
MYVIEIEHILLVSQASLPEHTVIESKPESTLEDLRCDRC